MSAERRGREATQLEKAKFPLRDGLRGHASGFTWRQRPGWVGTHQGLLDGRLR